MSCEQNPQPSNTDKVQVRHPRTYNDREFNRPMESLTPKPEEKPVMGQAPEGYTPWPIGAEGLAKIAKDRKEAERLDKIAKDREEAERLDMSIEAERPGIAWGWYR